MSQKSPVISGKRMVQFLESKGWEFDRQRGSHCMLIKEEEEITVPLHKELKKGTCAFILKKSGFSLTCFREYLSKK